MSKKEKSNREKYIEILRVRKHNDEFIKVLETGDIDICLDYKKINILYTQLNNIKKLGSEAFLRGEGNVMNQSFKSIPDAQIWWDLGWEGERDKLAASAVKKETSGIEALKKENEVLQTKLIELTNENKQMDNDIICVSKMIMEFRREMFFFSSRKKLNLLFNKIKSVFFDEGFYS